MGENTSPREGSTQTSSGVTKGQVRLIIGLLSVLIIVVAAVGVWFVIGGKDGSDSVKQSRTVSSSTTAPSDIATVSDGEEEEVDPVAMLENAGPRSVNPPPVPEAVESWGDYVKHRSWSGTLRVHEGLEATPVPDDGGGTFPATMNGCRAAMFLVTFRSVNEDVLLDAQLRNAAGGVDVTETLSEGWTLGTNCSTPQFGFSRSAGISNLGDVSFDVTEYRQSSAAAPEVEEVTEAEAVAGADAVTGAETIAEPTLIQCDNGLTIMGLFSDGSWRTTEECDTPEHRQSVRAEGVCGGLYGWQQVSAEEYESLCGVPPPSAASSGQADEDFSPDMPDAVEQDAGATN